jgi:ubiquinone/menaquinone biosynthesis C-methylase UbiE
MKIVRTHDSFYKSEFFGDKQSFDEITRLIETRYEQSKNKLKLIDIGCAAGEFPNVIQSYFPELEVLGVDFLAELVDEARKRFPQIAFKQGNVLDSYLFEDNYADIITIIWVLSIFDDINPLIVNVSKWIKPGGVVFYHGMFNPHPIDVYIKYQLSEHRQFNEIESGWNIISQQTFSDICIKNGAKRVLFHPFIMKTDISANPNDPIRSWTETLKDGQRQIVNGLHLKQPQYIAEVTY